MNDTAQMTSGRVKLKIPKDMPTALYRAPREVELPVGSEIPLFSPDLPEEKQVQEVWTVRVRVFTLPAEQEELEKVWQQHVEGKVLISEHQMHFNERTSNYQAYLRWAEIRHCLPDQVGDARD